MDNLGDYLARKQADRAAPRILGITVLTLLYVGLIALIVWHGHEGLAFIVALFMLFFFPQMWREGIKRSRRYYPWEH